MPNKRQTSNWEKVAGFIFGIAFVITLLVMAVIIPNPTPEQYATFKTILALAAAGVGGVLSGFIHVEGTLKQWSIRAGGALALFLIVFFFTPEPPPSSGSRVRTGDVNVSGKGHTTVIGTGNKVQ